MKLANLASETSLNLRAITVSQGQNKVDALSLWMNIWAFIKAYCTSCIENSWQNIALV